MAIPLYRPSTSRSGPLNGFRHYINRKHALDLATYNDLHHYSVENYSFWQDLWEYIGIVYSVPPEQVVAKGSSDHNLSWFPGARLNYAENLLVHNDDTIACTAINEYRIFKDYSYRQLRQMVAAMAAAMRVNGLQPNDRIAAVITNSITAVVISLASASIGSILSCSAPDMGLKGILDRYRQIQPKIIFLETEVSYGGKLIHLSSKAAQIIESLTEVGLHIGVLLPSAVASKEATLNIPNSITLSRFLASGDDRPLVFEQLPFEHPLCILYSSGTTGPPKCIVHSTGGILLQTMKEVAFFFGVNRHDTYLQYTTTGWMMWTLMLGVLAWGSRLILYDGSPSYPDNLSFLRLIHDQKVSILSTSPRFLAVIRERGVQPKKVVPFTALRTVILGGASVTAALHRWASNAFGPEIRIAVGMGGTDICSAFIITPPTIAVHAGEISAKNLGIKVEVFDEFGRNIEGTGEPGELVCTRPHPTIPLCFWGDKGGDLLKKTYFDKYPGIWKQGDFVSVNPKTKGFYVLGRSDGVLNPKGIRFGSAEIYSILEQFSASVDDSVCVGQRKARDGDERVLLFLKMRPGRKFTKQLVLDIKTAIRTGLSARHVPEIIAEVKDIPYTANGKKMEVTVKQIVSGSKSTPGGAIANAESLQEYYRFFTRSKL